MRAGTVTSRLGDMDSGHAGPDRGDYDMTDAERQAFIDRVRRELPESDRRFAEATAEIERLNRLRFGRYWPPRRRFGA